MRLQLAAIVLSMAFLAGALGLSRGPSSLTPAEQFALRVDDVLDQMEEPTFYPENLYPYWAFEIAPFFEYEGMTTAQYHPPEVIFEPQAGGMEHNHLLGYTYCRDQVWINIRVINSESSWYGWARNPLATLVHEMVHTLGGDFCGFNSATTESSTQTGTLEILAALANGGNKVALYSLLLELRDMAMDVALSQALKANDLDGYREFRKQVEPGALEEARFEKSMRFWADDIGFLQEILTKYSVKVFANMQKGEISLTLPGPRFVFVNEKETLLLNDLTYFVENLEALAEDAGDKEI